jgi:hypothetical protein
MVIGVTCPRSSVRENSDNRTSSFKERSILTAANKAGVFFEVAERLPNSDCVDKLE